MTAGRKNHVAKIIPQTDAPTFAHTVSWLIMNAPRPIHPLRSLHAKLTLSYMIGVVATMPLLLTVSVAVFPALFYQELRDPSPVVALLAGRAPAIAASLGETPPNVPAIATEVDILRRRDGSDDMGGAIRMSVSGAVTNAVGVVVYSSPPGAFAVGTPLAVQVTPGEREIIGAARRGDTDPTRLGIGSGNGDNTVAVAAMDAGGTVRGVIFARVRQRVDIAGTVRYFGAASVLPFAVIVAVSVFVGIVFGSLMARTLTRRLRAIAGAATDWGRGEFATTAPQYPPDELGVLGIRLNAMAQEVATLVTLQQELAATNERARLARDLHDTVKQHAFAAALQTATALELLPADPQTARQHTARAATLIGRMQHDLMAILRDLSANEVGAATLADLPAHLEAWSRETGIAVTVSVDGGAATGANAVSLRRIVDEALANIVRHSGATWVSVALVAAAGRFSLTITDNGCGFAPAEVPQTGMGLTNMQERARSLPGTLALESAPGTGTKIVVVWSAATP